VRAWGQEHGVRLSLLSLLGGGYWVRSTEADELVRKKLLS